MKNSNIIISVIIVLCIAAAVTAYGIANKENNIFTNLTGFTPTEDPTTNDNLQGIGNGGSGDGGSGKEGLAGGSDSNEGSGSEISYLRALEIAKEGIKVHGCSPGDPKKLTNGNWYVPVLNDSNGEVVDGFEIDYKTGHRSRI